jgi:eukaryotic-like serine/threonine-protein kinase
MSWLSDEAISRLQLASALPDLGGTRYRLVGRVGSGGMGTVYLAEDSVLGRRVALKILDLPDVHGELSARLLREAHILARLEHPGIVPVHDAGTLTDGRVFYAMKFVEGERLDALAKRMDTLSDRLRIFQRICEAVAFAHARGILHRDLKPENIMVGPFGEVLVMDWGIAKILREDAGASEHRQPQDVESPRNTLQRADPLKTAHGTILGTPGYMAPEQARGEIDRLDERADVYSLGAILQFLVTGARPGKALASEAAESGVTTPVPSAAEPASSSAPKAVAAIVRMAMASNSTGRYASVSDLMQDVARYLDGLPVSAYPENVFQKAARLVSRYRVAIGLVLAYLVVRALLLLWFRH